MTSTLTQSSSRRAIKVALIGAGIQQSGSPALHMTEGTALGLHYSYELLDTDLLPEGAQALPRLLAEAQRSGYAGLNITYPCKQAVIPLLDTLSPEADALQSVNTVVFAGTQRIGYNTDCWGFAENLHRGLADAIRQRVVLVGAGGAGSAVGYAVLQWGARTLQIHDLDPQRALALAARLSTQFPNCEVTATGDLESALAHADGLIHASPMGLAKLPGLPVPAQFLRPPLWVADVVYVPLVTQLLAQARAAGCRTLDGGGMAVFQAAKAFELFTGIKPDAERMLTGFNARMRLNNPAAAPPR